MDFIHTIFIMKEALESLVVYFNLRALQLITFLYVLNDPQNN